MRVETRMGVLKDRVIADGVEYQVHRVRGGWRELVDPRGGGRVRYDGWRDRLDIRSPGGALQIQFHWRHTTFTWRESAYRIRARIGGGMTILKGERPVAEGRMTFSGSSFEFNESELFPIGRELAIGLAARSQAFTMGIILGAAH